MVDIEIVGYKKISKNGKTLYHLSALSTDTPKGCEGYISYNGFVTDSYIKACNINEENLLGAKGKFYNVKDGDGYKSVISLK